VAATLPLILLLRLADLVNSPCQGGNCSLLFKFFSCPDPIILSVFFVMNYAHLMYRNCRWLLLLMIGCTYSPKKIERIS
jgi:hypothetical protein